MKIKKSILFFLHNRLNKKNQRRLNNITPTLVCSNCAGGYIYHWLGLQFRSPFINLFLSPEDFVKALENFDEFIDTPIEELLASGESYPIGIGAYGIKIHFMHYGNFSEALLKWNERKKRIDKDNMGIILSNVSKELYGGELLKRFDALPYKHKVVFVTEEMEDIKSAIYLRHYKPEKKNLYRTISLTGKRCIDYFDYVRFINDLQEK